MHDYVTLSHLNSNNMKCFACVLQDRKVTGSNNHVHKSNDQNTTDEILQ